MEIVLFLALTLLKPFKFGWDSIKTEITCIGSYVININSKPT